MLVIVESLDVDRLAAASAASRAWADAGNPAPLTLTESEWRGSADIFPMEYADILERHRVLFGEPPFDGIHVDTKDLRLQVEQEAMGKLLRLRQGVLASGNDAQRQLELLSASVSTFLVIFRAFERLHGTKPAADNVTLAGDVARRAGFEPDAVVRAKAAVKDAKLLGYDVAIVDTAGRLHIDEVLMDEVSRIRDAAEPDEILFVADAMTGQDAVRSAEAFAAKLPLTGGRDSGIPQIQHS